MVRPYLEYASPVRKLPCTLNEIDWLGVCNGTQRIPSDCIGENWYVKLLTDFREMNLTAELPVHTINTTTIPHAGTMTFVL